MKRKDLVILNSIDSRICGVIGPNIPYTTLVNRNLKVGFFVWARNKPKALFKQFIEISKQISKYKMGVWIDDICSKAYMKLDENTQNLLNEKYDVFFNECEKEHMSCISRLSSYDFFRFLLCVSAESYRSFLPKTIKDKDDLFMVELLHTFFEINTIRCVADASDVILLGKKSSNIAYYYHRYIDDSVIFLIIDLDEK